MMLPQTTFVLLLSILGGVDDDAREAEVARLSAEGASAIPTLTRVLDVGRWRARAAAVDGLARVGEPAIPTLMNVVRRHAQVDARRLAILALGRLLEASAPDSLMLFSETSDRGSVVTALGWAGCEPPVIRPFFHDDAPDVRRRAVEAYAKAIAAHPGPGGIDPLVDLLADSHHMVRETSAAALVESGPNGPNRLLTALRSLRPSFRVSAVRALNGHLKDDLIEPLVEHAESVPWTEQVAVVGILSGTAPGRAALAGLDASSFHPVVRSRIERALEADGGD